MLTHNSRFKILIDSGSKRNNFRWSATCAIIKVAAFSVRFNPKSAMFEDFKNVYCRVRGINVRA